jgi:hypothetical protein
VSAAAKSEKTEDAVDNDRVQLFLGRISQRIAVGDFMHDFHALFPFIHESGLTECYRLGRGLLKRIRDEAAILAHFLELVEEPYGHIQLFLNSDIPDARLWRDQESIDIEISQVQAKARFFLMEELSRSGSAIGFLPIDDSQPYGTFAKAMRAQPECYSTSQYVGTLKNSISRCLSRKSRSDRSGYLLIGAPIGKEYVSSSALSALQIDVPASGLERVYLVDRDRLLQIA